MLMERPLFVKHFLKSLGFSLQLGDLKVFPLMRYFSIASLVCMLIAAFLLASLYRNISVENLIEYGEQKNAVLAQALANTIWPEFAPFIPTAIQLNQEQLRDHSETRKIHTSIVRNVEGLNVLKIKIFDLNGFTLFSTDASQTGTQKPADYPGSISARTGQAISKLSFRKQFTALSGVVHNRHVISSYLPIRKQQSNKIQGVFEVYTDVTKFFEKIEETKFYVASGVLFILFVLYAALLFLVKTADHIIKEQADELAIKRDEALNASRAKSDFLANMSHELRTPLNAIIGYSELLMEDVPEVTSYMRKDLDKITNSGKHLLGLINNILDLSKIEAGRMDNHIEKMDINSAIQTLIATVGPLVEKQNNKFVSTSSVSGTMETDITKFRQIILNLISNAAKFTENGTISVQVSLEKENDQEWVFIKVSDTGIGMPPAQQVKIFEAFTQAEESTTRKYGGTGLGLTITKQLCSLLGGSISIESEVDKGSRFTVKLPRFTPSNKVIKVKQSLQKKTKPDPIKVRLAGKEKVKNNKRKIIGSVLVIDDEKIAQELVERFLTARGFQVYTAARADEGIKIAREKKPNIILLDIMMPEKDGWTALSELKADEELKDIPVIIASLVADKSLGQSLGAEGCIDKPFNLNELVNAVVSIVRAGK